MPAITSSTQAYTAQRITLSSAAPVSTVLAALDTALKRAANSGTSKALDIGALTAEEYEQRITDSVGEAGFMFFAAYTHSAWLALFPAYYPPPLPGQPSATPLPTTTTYVLGNPLIARTMLTHDLRAGLCVPVRVAVLERPGEGGTDIVYDLPSSIIALPGYGQGEEGNERLAEAARKLDAKLERLLRGVLGED